MKKVYVLAALWTLALTMVLSSERIAQANADQDHSQSAQQASQEQQQPMQDGDGGSAKAKTFMGKIVEADGKLVLQDTASNTTYQLDDQEKAKKFVDQQVKVTGTLDAASGTIRVSAIEKAA